MDLRTLSLFFVCCGPWAIGACLHAPSAATRGASPAAGGAPVLERLHIRAYADQAYRAQDPRWRENIREQVAQSNTVLGSVFGVALAIDVIRPWSRQDVHEDMTDTLRSLSRLDPGNDVDWVVGFIAPLQEATSLHHHLGHAYCPGKHFVVRGVDTASEQQAFEKRASSQPAAPPGAGYEQWVADKRVALLLHEWAHTLGALHTDAPVHYLHPEHGADQARFSEPNQEVIRLALRHLLAPAAAEDDDEAYRAWATELHDLLLKPRLEDERNSEEKANLVGFLQRMIEPEETQRPQAPFEDPNDTLIPEDFVRFVREAEGVKSCRVVGMYRTRVDWTDIGKNAAQHRAAQQMRRRAARNGGNTVLLDERIRGSVLQLTGDIYACGDS